MATKQAMFTLKLESDLRDDFIAEAEAVHQPASQVARQLFREFVERQRLAREHDAFVRAKVEAARVSVGRERVLPNEVVEADFAARREALASRV